MKKKHKMMIAICIMVMVNFLVGCSNSNGNSGEELDNSTNEKNDSIDGPIDISSVDWDTMQGLLIMECAPTGDTGKYGGYEFKLTTESAQEGTFDVETVTIEIALNGSWSLPGEYENVTRKDADEILVELVLPEDGYTETYFGLQYIGTSSMSLDESVQSVFMLRPDSGTFTPD